MARPLAKSSRSIRLTSWCTTGWDKSKAGKVKTEGWPGYSLETGGDNTTLVRLHARMHTYGIYRLTTPILRRIAVRERTATIDALKASFESNDQRHE